MRPRRTSEDAVDDVADSGRAASTTDRRPRHTAGRQPTTSPPNRRRQRTNCCARPIGHRRDETGDPGGQGRRRRRSGCSSASARARASMPSSTPTSGNVTRGPIRRACAIDADAPMDDLGALQAERARGGVRLPRSRRLRSRPRPWQPTCAAEPPADVGGRHPPERPSGRWPPRPRRARHRRRTGARGRRGTGAANRPTAPEEPAAAPVAAAARRRRRATDLADHGSRPDGRTARCTARPIQGGLRPGPAAAPRRARAASRSGRPRRNGRCRDGCGRPAVPGPARARRRAGSMPSGPRRTRNW